MIGLDTSHVERFISVLNDPEFEHYRRGFPVVTAYPAGSPDFALSIDRVEGYTDLARRRGVEIVGSPEAVAERADAILMTSVDGRTHREFFERVAPAGKPVFIDKPFAVRGADARSIVDTAQTSGTPVMGASSLRFEDDLVAALADDAAGPIQGCDFAGPMEIEPTQPGLFWYGIHTVEMVYAALGCGCARVRAISEERRDTIIGEWADGRVATLRGCRTGNHAFFGMLHRETASRHVRTGIGRPKYVNLLDRVIEFFCTGDPAVDPHETVETIRFIEAANRSRETGESVDL